MAFSTSLRSSLSFMPAAWSVNSFSSASLAGVLYCLYLSIGHAKRLILMALCSICTYSLPAAAIALDGGTLLLVKILRKFGKGILVFDASLMVVQPVLVPFSMNFINVSIQCAHATKKYILSRKSTKREVERRRHSEPTSATARQSC